jgi:GR25 family glycosyltransferase involved in LPS biosynthesis
MKIYYINLDSREDRNVFFLNQFRSSVIDPVRISAASPSAENVNIASPGQSGCWSSHQKAYNLLIESGDSHALIFEDDAKVSLKFLKTLENLKNLNLDGIDLFQLGYLKDSNKLTVDSGKVDCMYRWKLIIFDQFRSIITKSKKLGYKNLSRFDNQTVLLRFENEWKEKMRKKIPLVYNSFEAGTHCYIISNTLAKSLVNFNCKPVLLAADLLLIEVANSRFFKCLRVSKSLSNQKSALGSNVNLRRQLLNPKNSEAI